MNKNIKIIIGFFGLFLFWGSLSQLEYLQTPPQIAWFASPFSVYYGIKEVIFNEYWNLVYTLLRVIVSIVIVLIPGLLTGLLLGYFKNFYEFCESILDFWRSIPPIVVIPIFFFVNPNGEASRVALVVFGCFPIIVLQIADRIEKISTERLDFAEHIGASLFFKIRNILIYEVLPSVFINVRTAVSLSFIIIVVTEIVYSPAFGVGHGINESRYAENGRDVTYAYAIIIGGLGFGFNLITRWIEDTYFNWSK